MGLADSIGGGIAGGAVVSIVIKAQDQYSKELGKAQTSLQKFGKVAQAVSLAYAASIGATMALGVKQAMDEEKALAKLTQQLKNYGYEADRGANELSKLATSLQRMTGYSDDQIIAGQAMLATFGLNIEQIKKLSATMLDFATVAAGASGEQMDLASVAKIMGKAVEGETASLSRYGIVLTDAEQKSIKAASETERFAMVMKIFEERTNGAAEAVGNTLSGKMKILKASFEDFAQSLSEKSGLLGVLDYAIEKLQKVMDGFDNLSEEKKSLLTAGIVGSGMIATGAGIYLNNLGATPLNPVYTKEVGLGGALSAGGAAAGAGAAAKTVGAVTIGTIASAVLDVISIGVLGMLVANEADKLSMKITGQDEGVVEKSYQSLKGEDTFLMDLWKKINSPWAPSSMTTPAPGPVQYTEAESVAYFKSLMQPNQSIMPESSVTAPVEEPMSLTIDTLGTFAEKVKTSEEATDLNRQQLEQLTGLQSQIYDIDKLSYEQQEKMIAAQVNYETIIGKLNEEDAKMLDTMIRLRQATEQAAKALADKMGPGYYAIQTKYNGAGAASNEIHGPSNVTQGSSGTWSSSLKGGGSYGVNITNNYSTQNNSAAISRRRGSATSSS